MILYSNFTIYLHRHFTINQTRQVLKKCKMKKNKLSTLSKKQLIYLQKRKKNADFVRKSISKEYDRLKKKDIRPGRIIEILMDRFNVSRQTVYNAIDINIYKTHTGNAGVRPVGKASA